MFTALVITIYISLSSYEIVFREDIRYINAVQAFQSPWLINTLVGTNKSPVASRQQLAADPNLPQSLNFNNISFKLDLTPAVKSKKGEWLEIANRGNYIVMDKTSNETGNLIVYFNNDWRTIADPTTLKNGGKFYLKTDKYTNMYKIVDTKIEDKNNIYIMTPSESSSILLVIDDKTNKVNYFIKAEFVSQEVNNKI
jgi:hypothetical protein